MRKLLVVITPTIVLLLITDCFAICAENEPWKKYDMDRATYEELTSDKLRWHPECGVCGPNVPDFRPYDEYVDKRIKSRWIIKPNAKPIVLSFKANADGQITDIAIRKSAASDQDNREAIKFIRSCAPLAPFPPGADASIDFATYTLNVDSTEENRLNDLLKLAGESKPREAERLLNKAIELSTKIYGQDFPQTISAMNELAWCYQQSNVAKEEKLLWQIVNLIKNNKIVTEDESRQLCGTLCSIAMFSERTKKYKQAEFAYREAIEILKKYPEGLPLYLMKLGDVYVVRKNIKEAEATYKKALVAAKLDGSLPSYDQLDSLDKLAELYLNQKRYSEAESYYKRELALYQIYDKPFSFNINFKWFSPYIQMLHKQKRLVEAKEVEKKVLAIKRISKSFKEDGTPGFSLSK
ncbi:MAG: TonB family protein [Candidatus Obscuribacterales bacterium]|nr:TonB family protein [Candidatus Obscuribacterales bacterium]